MPPGKNIGEGGTRPPPSTPSLLLLTSGDRKNKITEFDDRRLTLCHAKFVELGFRFRYSFICLGTSTRRQWSDLFGLQVKSSWGESIS